MIDYCIVSFKPSVSCDFSSSVVNSAVYSSVSESVAQTEQQPKRWHHPSTQWKMQQRRQGERGGGGGVLPRWYHYHCRIGWGQRWCHTSPSCSPELWTEAGVQRERERKKETHTRRESCVVCFLFLRFSSFSNWNVERRGRSLTSDKKQRDVSCSLRWNVKRCRCSETEILQI